MQYKYIQTQPVPRDEGDGKSLGAEAARATHSVQVLVALVGEVVVDHDVHALDVDAAAEEVGGHQDALGEVLEGLEAGDALLLLQLQ